MGRESTGDRAGLQSVLFDKPKKRRFFCTFCGKDMKPYFDQITGDVEYDLLHPLAK